VEHDDGLENGHVILASWGIWLMGGCGLLASDHWYPLRPSQRMAKKEGRLCTDELMEAADIALKAQIADYNLVRHAHTA